MATARISRKLVIENAEDKLTWMASELSARKERRIRALTRPRLSVFGLYSIMGEAEAKRRVEDSLSYRMERASFDGVKKRVERLLDLANSAKGDLTLSETEFEALV